MAGRNGRHGGGHKDSRTNVLWASKEALSAMTIAQLPVRRDLAGSRSDGRFG